MRIEQKKESALDDIIAVIYQILGAGRRQQMVRLAIRPSEGVARAATVIDFFGEREVRMSKANVPFNQVKIWLGIAVLVALTGCVGYVDGGYGGAVVVPGPDMYIYGGGYYGGGRDVHVDSHRGFASRAAAHAPSGGRGIKR